MLDPPYVIVYISSIVAKTVANDRLLLFVHLDRVWRKLLACCLYSSVQTTSSEGLVIKL